jgi:hypothetical protein
VVNCITRVIRSTQTNTTLCKIFPTKLYIQDAINILADILYQAGLTNPAVKQYPTKTNIIYEKL